MLSIELDQERLGGGGRKTAPATSGPLFLLVSSAITRANARRQKDKAFENSTGDPTNFYAIYASAETDSINAVSRIPAHHQPIVRQGHRWDLARLERQSLELSWVVMRVENSAAHNQANSAPDNALPSLLAKT